MQVWADGSSPEFTPIGEWVREHSVYNMMRQLRFFKTYMPTRYLRTWRSSARAQAFDRVRKKLEARLMCAKPEFCYTLMDLQHKVRMLGKVKHVIAARVRLQQCVFFSFFSVYFSFLL